MEGDSTLCENCSTHVAGNAKFCPECGIQVAKRKKKSCPNCNVAVECNAKFCIECGEKLDVASKPKHYTCVCGKNNIISVRFCPECGESNSPHPLNKGAGSEVGKERESCGGHGNNAGDSSSSSQIGDKIMEKNNEGTMGGQASGTAFMASQNRQTTNLKQEKTSSDQLNTASNIDSLNTNEDGDYATSVDVIDLTETDQEQTDSDHLNATNIDTSHSSDVLEIIHLTETDQDDNLNETAESVGSHSEKNANKESESKKGTDEQQETGIEQKADKNEDVENKQAANQREKTDKKGSGKLQNTKVKTDSNASKEKEHTGKNETPPASAQASGDSAKAKEDKTLKQTDSSVTGPGGDAPNKVKIKRPPKTNTTDTNDENATTHKPDDTNKNPSIFSNIASHGKDKEVQNAGADKVFGGAVDETAMDTNSDMQTPDTNRNNAGANTSETAEHTDKSEQNDNSGAKSYADVAKQDNKNEGGYLYRKHDQPEEEYQKPKEKTKKEKNKKTAGEKQFGTDTIDVNFHVVVAKQFKFDPNKHQIQLRSGDLFGSWDKPQPLVYNRTIGDSLHLMTLKVFISKSILAHGRKLEYKYTCYKIEKDSDKRVDWEFLFRKTYAGSLIENRLLYIPQIDLKERGEWHQYDGVMHRKPQQNVFAQLVSYFTGKEHDEVIRVTKTAARAMLPNLGDIGKTGAFHLLEDIQQVYRCLRPQLCKQDCYSYNEQYFGEIMAAYVTDYFKKLKKMTEKATQTVEEATQRIALALTLMNICMKYGVHFLQDEVRLPLMQALSVRTNSTTLECVDVDSLMEFHFPDTTRKTTQNFLMRFLEDTASRGDVSWILALSLLHFVSGAAKPSVTKRLGREHYTEEWWGIEKITRAVDKFKDSIKTNKDIPGIILERVVPHIKVDYLIQRSFVALLSWSHLEDVFAKCQIDSVVCLANMWYFIDNKKVGEYDFKQVTRFMVDVNKKLLEEQDLTTENKETVNFTMANLNTECGIAMDFLNCVLHFKKPYYTGSKWNYHGVIEAAAQAVILVILKFERAFKKFSEEKPDDIDKKFKTCIKDRWEVLAEKVRDWYNDQLSFLFIETDYGYRSRSDEYKFSNAKEFEVLSNLLGLDFYDSDRVEFWNKTFLSILQTRINKEIPRFRIIAFCLMDYERYHPLIEDCFTQVAFQVVESIQKGAIGDYNFIFDTSKRNYGKFREIVSKLLEKEWPEKDEQFEVVRFMLTWPTYLRYLHIFCGEGDQSNLLTDSSELLLVKSLSHMDITCQQLKSGEIALPLLDLILIHSKQFTEIHKVAAKGDETASITLALEIRRSELKKYRELKQALSVFIGYCAMFKNVNYEELQASIHADISQLKLLDICNPIPLDQLHGTCPEPTITIFDVPQEVYDIIPTLSAIKESITFSQLSIEFRKQAQKKRPVLEIMDVVDSVYNPALTMLKDMCQKVRLGEINLAEVDQLFGNFKHYSALERELEVMNQGQDKAWIPKRLKQIQDYHKLNTYQKGARIMQKVKDSFKLTGDFETLDVLANAGRNKQLPLHSISADVVNAGQDLKDIGKEESDCIAALHKCEDLVTWLQTNAKSTKEIKTLVDLATMSAQGQSDMDVQRVTSLNAAAIGYAPLIYDLKQTDDFKTFLKQCKQVWRSLKSDPDLPQHLLDTNRQLQWLKEVKETHGSVEVNALTQTANINARGMYRVGCDDPASLKSANKTLENVIRVVLTEDKKEKLEVKKYSYSQLCDLQSKLMLVAGKAEKGIEDVERFVEILDGVTRLATSYIKLCSAGCILFKNWNATFYCDPERGIHTEIDFGLKSDKNILRGYKKDIREVGVEIKLICEYMEACLKDWTKFINEQRDQFYYLNNYTTEQLVILCTELAKFCIPTEKNTHSQRIFHMLDRVRGNCTKQDLEKAIKSAFEDLRPAAPMDTESETDKPEQEATKMETDSEETALVVAFIEEVMKADKKYTEEFAKRALLEVKDPRDTNGGILWCFEHEDELMDVESNEAKEEIESESESDSGMDAVRSMIQNATLNEMKEALLKIADEQKTRALKVKLTEMWILYMQNSSSTSVADFLSIEHLGYILQHLADAGGKDGMQRDLSPSCHSGKANLVVCPENEIFHVCLSMYMEGNGKNLPLPTETEVLLCTAKTRYEEVELLLRRALGMYNHGKVFCLVNADRLEYEVGVQVEKFYEIHSKGHTNFQLVILCAKEREDKSTVVTAFERFRVNQPVLQDIGKIQQYIERRICVEGRLNPEPAATLDPTKCTVRIVKSHRAGVGKTLKAKRLAKLMETHLNRGLVKDPYVRINMHRKTIDTSDILRQLLEFTAKPEEPKPRLFHLDIAHEVQEGVDDFLFNLVILGSITDQEGFVWRRSMYDLYVIEAMPIMMRDQPRGQQGRRINEGLVRYAHQIFQYLPSLTCWSPTESRDILSGTPLENRTPNKHDQTMDTDEFESTEWQRVYQYLDQFHRGVKLQVNPTTPAGTPLECLNVLLRYCGLRDPSWAELRHFVWFLNIQLMDCDMSIFCDPMMAEDLPGFKPFVVEFMIQMSRDFATRSLKLAEESPSAVQNIEEEIGDLQQFQLKRRWESSPHPYVFFNADHTSMTFLGFKVDSKSGQMVDQQTGQTLMTMAKQLHDALIRNRVPLDENFDVLDRFFKIDKIHRVMGILEGYASYPDESYVLTTDNVKKIMAIYMRFRCGIPVIIMGETGCGKTRLIKFMCDLQKPADRPDIENMILMKVHGGTSAGDIERKIKKALQVAQHNKNACRFVDTVLFFDEANTTEEIGLIKRVMVDNEFDIQSHGLKIVAACNPYRKHSDEMIKRLEQAGLGYHIQADETIDKLGQVPMRRLVYRVQALPQSMLPLVWDFGQLDLETEKQYIQEMVNKCIGDEEEEDKLPRLPNLQQALSNILARSQDFMRDQKDECSFVSLRDVERVLRVMRWFYQHRARLFEGMNELILARRRGNVNLLVRNLTEDEEMEDEEEDDEDEYLPPNDVTRALILALGVCYHACLEKRAEYRQCVAPLFVQPFTRVTQHVLYEEINACQDVFLNELTLEENIARNQALKENVFMMVVCIELRIPLFLVGKPGSSKSLAKTIVADAMQGEASRSDLFKEFKSVHMVSYQCSPLATPQGIVGTFKQCADLQKKQNLHKYVSVVVLDEVGLAEDSPRMPLKALHPLLEDGCEGDEKPEPYMKVAFIGISNWALDPAKMNRGILVQRGVPDVEELKESAKGICAFDERVKNLIMPTVEPMAQAYLQLYKSALEIREFFGLRDFYSIIKMVYGFSKRSNKPPTWYELKHSILRNFGGLDTTNPLEAFEKVLNVDKNAERLPSDPDCTPAGLINACLFGKGIEGMNSENRYLLILTENYAALKILQQQLLQVQDAQYIFGSSFPKDQEYTQVCRNINRIKICMETGQTVVLMNLENLYESLYDALNQYYVTFGGQRFVDLGLGTHRVKCKVHKNFRLIVVAEKQVVYKKFPIPLINRLEKHTLTMETILSPAQVEMAKDLENWAKEFLPSQAMTRGFVNGKRDTRAELGDTFIGYEKDTAASVVLQVSTEYDEIESSCIEILDKCKFILLQCATPESIIRLRNSRLRGEEAELVNIYSKQQKHKSIRQFLDYFIVQQIEKEIFAQVTTHSKLLSGAEVQAIGKSIGIAPENIQLESLQAFDTEQQFCKQIKAFFKKEATGPNSVLVLQCDSGDENSTMIASARYNIMEAHRNQQQESDELQDTCRKHVVFIIQLPRKRGGCFTGFEGGKWLSYHIDDLQPETEKITDIHALQDKPVSELFPQNCDINQTLTENLVSLSLDESGNEGSAFRPIRNDEVMDVSETEVENQQMEVPLYPTVNSEPAIGQAKSRDVDTEQLIITCVHGAAAMLEDENPQIDRKTERVRILIELLDQNSEDKNLTLMKVMQVRLQHLLREREKSVMVGTTAHNWLTNEAASMDSIIKSGTLRRSVWHNLEEKVTPLLAGIIAHCDSNANLDLIVTSQPDHWINRLWLHMLFSPSVIRLKYQDIKSAKRDQELDRIQVRSHGCQGGNYRNSLPFSWVIKAKLDQLVHHAKTHKKDESAEELVEKVFSECAEGRLVHSMLSAQNMDEYLALYRRDYLRMVYKCQTPDCEDEYQLIEESIVKLSQYEQDAEVMEEEPKLTETRLHFIYAEIQSRIQLFSQALALKPEVVKMMSDSREARNVFSTAAEMTLDVQALVILLETLTPDNNVPRRKQERKTWLEQVEKYRPFIERMLDSFIHTPVDMHPHGDLCKQMFKTCRAMWSRICALQLFITNICTTAKIEEAAFSVDAAMTLWKSLGENADFKSEGTFKNLETFLRICNGKSHNHYLKDNEKCPSCDKPVEQSVKMPCKDKHVVCLTCVEQFRSLGMLKCPMCREAYDDKFNPKPSKCRDNKKLTFYKKYKQRCSSFFMEIVSRLCFAGDEPPSDDVIQKLLGYVTKDPGIETGDDTAMVSSQMNPFKDTIDPTPAVRSFLLQLLLRSNMAEVRTHLDNFFQRSSRVLKSDESHKLKLCLLFVHCMEDSLYGQYQQQTNSGIAIRFATTLLKQSPIARVTSQNTMEKLEAIASVRLGLHITADWLHKLYCTKEKIGGAIREINQLANAAAAICDQLQIKWPRLHLIRMINKTYGLDALKTISEDEHLLWILPPEARPKPGQNLVPADRLVVYGQSYATVKEALKRAMFSGDFQPVQDACNQIKSQGKRDKIFLLALNREITVYLIEQQIQAVPQDKQENLINVVNNADFIQNKEMAQIIIARDSPVMKNHNANKGIQCMINELLSHLLILLQTSDPTNKWLAPFYQLATKPQSMRGVYFPTMPQDHFTEILKTIDEARKREGTVTVYFCPNNHPYTIMNCGQPVTTGKCVGCGATIGGVGYKLAEGNVLGGNRGDTTAAGHILGNANARSKVPVPERKLPPSSTTLLRVLTHMAMYLGACKNPAQVTPLIAPAVPDNQVLQFIMDHVVHDVDDLRKALNKSPDDCCLFVHTLMSGVWQFGQERNLDPSLKTQKSREQWETRFNDVILNEYLTKIDQLLQDNAALMKDDQEKDANPLLKFLYETDTELENMSVEVIEESACMWQFRTRITTEHLAQIVNDNMPLGDKEKYKVLNNFIQQEHLLRAIRFLPDILRLQQLLIRKYNNSIDGAEANTITVHEFLSGLGDGPVYEEYVDLIQSFTQAWMLIRENLTTFVCGTMQVPKEYLNINVTNLDNVHLAMLLPSWRGEGICAIAVVNFLASIQNDFLESYGTATGITFEAGINVRECSLAHLIAYHPEKDLLPLVIATRNYTLLQGKDTKQHHDFETLQKQVEERFIKGKIRIKADVETVITFREDFTNAKVFKALNERIQQEPLSPGLMEDISREYRHMTDIVQSLSLLDITIGYLVSVGRDPDMMLKDFMKDRLTLKKMIHSEQAQRRCRLKHVQSLWCLLSHMKAKELHKLGHDPFDNIEETYKEDLTQEMKGNLHTALHHTNVCSFMAELYECIILHINVKQNTQDEDYTPNDTFPLGYSLHTYIEEKDGAPYIDLN